MSDLWALFWRDGQFTTYSVQIWFVGAVVVAIATYLILVGWNIFDHDSFWKLCTFTGVPFDPKENLVFVIMPLMYGFFWIPILIWKSFCFSVAGIHKMTKFIFNGFLWLKIIKWTRVRRMIRRFVDTVCEKLEEA